MDRPVYGAAVLMNLMHPLDGLLRRVGRHELVYDVDPLDDEHAAFKLDLAESIRGELLDFCIARCQRAGKGAGQSTCCCGDNVVEQSGILLANAMPISA